MTDHNGIMTQKHLTDMPCICVYRVVNTKYGSGIVRSFNRATNEIDVALTTNIIYGLKFSDLEVTSLIFKRMKS
jgi:hypothetical protein